MARGRALAAVLVASLLAISGAGASAAQSPKRGGIIVTPRPELPCLNPFACPLRVDDPALTQVLEGALEVGPDLVPRFSLVSAVTLGRKPFTLTYHVRREARWSDGVPVTADDFQFTHRTFATVGTPALDLRPLYRTVHRTRVLDAKTFRVELREPFADWRRLYPIVLPRHALAGQDLTKVWIDRIDNPRTRAPIGSGPYLVKGLERGRQLTLVRNPRYWGPHAAYVDRFVLPFLDPRDPLGPIRRNEVDVSLFVTEDVAREVRRLAGWRVAAWPGPLMEHLAFRVGPGGHPALRDTLVRRALAFGIDRDAIVRTLLAEAAPRARRPLDSTAFLPSEPFYRPNWNGYRSDPARARRLLEQAGCRRGVDGIYECAGERLSLRLVTTAGRPDRERVAELVKAQLRSAGVELTVEYAPFGALFGQILPSGRWDVALYAWQTNGGGVVWDEARCGDAENWTGFCSRLIMRDLQQTDFIVDPSQRARALNAGDAKLARSVPVLPLYQVVSRAAIRTRVRGVVAGGSELNIFQNTEGWWLAGPR